jgi:hypothetical protein
LTIYTRKQNSTSLAVNDKLWLYDEFNNPNAEQNCQQNQKDTTNSLLDAYGVITFNDGLSCYKWFGSSTIQATIDTVTACSVIPSPSPSPSNPPTPSITPTNTSTPTRTITPTNTITPTRTITPTNTITPTRTITPTNTITPTPTQASISCTNFGPIKRDLNGNGCTTVCSQSGFNSQLYGRYATFDGTVNSGKIYYPNSTSCTNEIQNAWGSERLFVKDGTCYGINEFGQITGSTICPSPTPTITPTVTPTSLPVFGLDWTTSANTTSVSGCTSAGWVITNRNLNIRFNISDSVDCGGTCGITQIAWAEATITVGSTNTNMGLTFVGNAERQDTNYEVIQFKLSGGSYNNVLLATATSPGGNLGCQMGPAIQTYNVNPPYTLIANTVYKFRIDFTTFDELFHLSAYYETQLSFT